LISIYRIIGDIQNYTNYYKRVNRKPHSHTRNIWERIIDQRWRQDSYIREAIWFYYSEVNHGNKSTIHFFARLTVKCKRKLKDLHKVFIEQQKAYARLPREALKKAIKKKGVHIFPNLGCQGGWRLKSQGASKLETCIVVFHP